MTNGQDLFAADCRMALTGLETWQPWSDRQAAWFEGVPFPVPTKAALEAGLTCMAIDQARIAGSMVDLGDWWAQLDAMLAPVAVS
ncbi:MAG: hypothetical protein PF961_02210 [Planctomycetota bacterium]|nr:hypothetical protein [Planctomycetota bacterium]